METITYSQVQELVQQLPEEQLPTAYRMLLELASHGEALQPQLEFLHLPLPERRRVLAQQAEELKSYYEQSAEERATWQAGDFLNESPTG